MTIHQAPGKTAACYTLAGQCLQLSLLDTQLPVRLFDTSTPTFGAHHPLLVEVSLTASADILGISFLLLAPNACEKPLQRIKWVFPTHNHSYPLEIQSSTSADEVNRAEVEWSR